jgi:hypothetical protein
MAKNLIAQLLLLACVFNGVSILPLKSQQKCRQHGLPERTNVALSMEDN